MKKKSLIKGTLLGLGVVGVMFANQSNAATINEAMDGSINTLTVCDENNSTRCITIMDRNLGATEAGIGCDEIEYKLEYVCSPGREYYGYQSYAQCYTECNSSDWGGGLEYCGKYCSGDLHGYDDEWECQDGKDEARIQCIMTNTGSYGNYYQWGNNYGFSSSRIQSSAVPGTVNTYNVDLNTSKYGPGNWYISNVFKIVESSPHDWSSMQNDDLRGDSTALAGDELDERGDPIDIVEVRQGPCPSGYHIPTKDEWQRLLSIRAGADMYDEYIQTSNATINHLQRDFKIPFAGRYGYDAMRDDFGEGASLWTSSPAGNTARGISVRGGDDNMVEIFSNFRASAYPIRCFRNSALTLSSSGTGDGQNQALDLVLNIERGQLTIGIDVLTVFSGIFNLGSLKTSNDIQVKTGAFGSNSFRVDDQKGVESGYYTTLSVTDLVGENPAHVIGAENIQLKSENSTVSLISGTPVNESYVGFSNQIQDWVTATGSITYFNRQNTPTANAGRLGKYGDNLQIKVSVPAHTMADTYRGTITYTLYDLDE